jgi:FlaA1/EpsC-like NDP-sugar epimerase
MVIVVLAYVVAILMLYFRDISASTFDWSRIWLVPVIYFLAFLISKTYDGMLRYSGFNDIQKIFYACTGALSFLIISKLVIRQFSPQLATDLYPRYVTLIYHYLITMVVMIIMRFSIRRLYNEVYKNVADKMNTIIYGAGDGGTMLMRTLSQDTNSKFRIKAFVDDNPKRVGTQINTIKIYSPKVAMTPNSSKNLTSM